jgi:hypothetical protein
MVTGGVSILALKFPQIKLHSLELALQSWFKWTDSVRVARQRLGWNKDFSTEEWGSWSRGLDPDIVWRKAITNLDKLNLPRLFAGYWIACLVSRYDSEDIHTFSSIEYPYWVLERLYALEDTFFKQKPPFRHRSSSRTIKGLSPYDGFSNRALPPSFVCVAVAYPASFVTFHIPIFMLPGLIYNPSSLQELMKEIVEEYGQHPVSGLLKQVGRSVGWEGERNQVKEASDEQLRPLYDWLMQSEYLRDTVEYSSVQDIKKAIKSLPAGTRDELLVAARLESKLAPSERKKIKCRVRKRVSGWFKEAGRWPVPPE